MKNNKANEQKKKLVKLCLVISLIGILLLIILSQQIKPQKTDIINITKDYKDKTVSVYGNITSIANFSDFQILNIKDNTGEIKVILNSQNLINKTNNTLIIGKVKEYESELEIQADRITKIED